MITEQEMMTALREVYDPEIPINIVDLGLIYRLTLTDGKALVEMTLTSPGCPLAGSLAQDVEDCLRKLPGITEVEVRLIWDPPWTPDRINREALDHLFSSQNSPPTAPAQPT
jgi:metal-sulfur cluster biosynthetic enzyme